LDQTAIILASGFSEQFNQTKALMEFNDKPLIAHVANSVDSMVDEIIIVSETVKDAKTYSKLVACANVVVNETDPANLLLSAKLGLESAKGTQSLLVSSDAPLLSSDVVRIIFELCKGKTAAIPRSPDQKTEYLRSVFHTQSALKAANMALEDGYTDLSAMVNNLGGVRYISTLVIQEFDPDLKTLFNVNTPVDLKMAETLSKPKPWLTRKQRKHQL
jgi:molybdopterin-guanine dinucleotide biosynthesis protein A